MRAMLIGVLTGSPPLSMVICRGGERDDAGRAVS
jgi:hypothetical protein